MTYHANMTRAEFIEAALARSKAEILEDIGWGIIPANVKDFSTLHDHVDANCYGGFCETQLNPVFDALFPDKADDEVSSQEFYRAANEVQEQVHQWLLKGRPK